jgi:hypothetical protein
MPGLPSLRYDNRCNSFAIDPMLEEGFPRGKIAFVGSDAGSEE